ncbi:hypothetical protein T492DRAFT_240202 [Pavlovales sp. CCMP2436]|nr:hypothetical protein T492DRAFT_240202 [Pavlovales sp. CCMP2436]
MTTCLQPTARSTRRPSASPPRLGPRRSRWTHMRGSSACSARICPWTSPALSSQRSERPRARRTRFRLHSFAPRRDLLSSDKVAHRAAAVRRGGAHTAGERAHDGGRRRRARRAPGCVAGAGRARRQNGGVHARDVCARGLWRSIRAGEMRPSPKGHHTYSISSYNSYS